MATRRIDTTIALDGEQAFKRAMSDAAREIRVQESAIKSLTAAYENNGDKSTMLTGKQSALRAQIEQEEEIIKALETRLKKFQEDPERNARGIQDLSIQLNSSRTKLENYKKSLSQTDREVEELGRDSTKAGRQIAEGIGEGAEDAEDDVRSLMETMRESLADIQGNVSFETFSNIAGGIKNAAESVGAFVDGTIDYRRQLSFLQLNANMNNFDFGNIKSQMIELTTLTGETSSAIEGLNNLMAIDGMDAATMQRAIEGLGGAVASFPETMNFESLADSLQETLASGQATGQFSELLSRLGVDVENFNTALQNSPTAVGDLNIALSYLASNGLNEVYTTWRGTNDELIAALEAEAKLKDNSAELASEIETTLVTPFKELKALIIEEVTAGIREAKAALDSWAEEQGWTSDTTGRTGSPDWWRSDQYVESPYEIINGQLVLKRGASAEAAASQSTTAEIERTAQQMAEDYASTFNSTLEAELDMSKIGEAVEAQSTKVVSDSGQNLAQIAERSMDQILNSLDMEAYYKELESSGEEAGETLVEGLETGAGGGGGAALNYGTEFGRSYAQGIFSQVSYVASAAGALAAAAASRLSTGGVGAMPGAYFGGILNIDGRQAGTFLAPFVAEQIAVVQ